MNLLVMGFSLFLCALVQAVLPAWRGMGQAKLPLLLGGVLYYALTRDEGETVLASTFAGLLQDALGPIPMGFSILCFCVVGLVANHYRDRVFGEQWITHVLIGMSAAVAVTVMMYVLLLSNGLRQLTWTFVLGKAVGPAVLAFFCVPAVFKAIEWLDHKLGNVRLGDTT